MGVATGIFRYLILVRRCNYFRLQRHYFHFRCRSMSDNVYDSSSRSGIPQTWVKPLEFLKYPNKFPSYKYFRFSGRHIGFLWEWWILGNWHIHRWIGDPRKCGGRHWNFVPSRSRTRDMHGGPKYPPLATYVCKKGYPTGGLIAWSSAPSGPGFPVLSCIFFSVLYFPVFLLKPIFHVEMLRIEFYEKSINNWVIDVATQITLSIKGNQFIRLTVSDKSVVICDNACICWMVSLT